jgi:vitamin B12 transporter
VEVTADWLIGKSLTAGAWYNYTEGEITEITDSGNTTSSNLVRRPQHSIGLDLMADLSEKWSLNINAEWNGERTDLYFNPANNFAAEDVFLDSYTLVNLYTEYRFGEYGITFFGDVKNLLNSDFTEVYGFNTMGTALKGGVKVQF